MHVSKYFFFKSYVSLNGNLGKLFNFVLNFLLPFLDTSLSSVHGIPLNIILMIVYSIVIRY